MLDRDLYARGAATLLASWEAYARGSAGAFLLRLDGVAAAVFPNGPERAIYNNAVFDRGLDAAESPSAVDAMESAYRSASIVHFAAWAHETEEGPLAELRRRGYAFSESTRAMGMHLDEIPREVRGVEVEQLNWAHYLEYLSAAGFPAGLLQGVDPRGFHVLGIRIGDSIAATAIAFDHEGDCGIFNMSTQPAFRRQGLGTALTVRHLLHAAERGCSTASLQATEMAERVYAAVGFRDLGRFLEHVPGD